MTNSNRSEVIKFITQWRDDHEGRVFDLKNNIEKEKFLKAVSELGSHVAHTARQSRMFAIADDDGITTVYLKVEN